jgi:dihydrolipoamide dehydrogenase
MMTTKSEAQGSLDEAQREALLELALKPVRHILVPLDLSHGSLSTIRQAIRLGQHFGSRITLLHVYQQPIAFEISRGTNFNTELIKDQRQTEESLKEQGTLLRAAYPNCEWILRSGDAGAIILEVALELPPIFGFQSQNRRAIFQARGSMSDRYQLAIVGSGSGGREATRLAAQNSLHTALIERNRIGGTCFHSGCYAVLALQASARQYRDRWRSGRFGNKVELLAETLRDWTMTQSNVSSRLADDFRTELERLGVDLYYGQGSFLDERTLEVVEVAGTIKKIVFDHAIVATGSRPAFTNKSASRLVDSDELLRIQSSPRHLAIIGGGYIGCEFASIYRTLGCAVTVIEKQSRVLPGWESEAGERVAQTLEMRGVSIQLGRNVALHQIEEYEEGVRIPVPGYSAIEADLVLIATGRRPNLEGLGLRALGIDDTSFLKVDDRMRLPRPGLYAVGDVNGINLLDSTAFSQASVAISSILGLESRLDQTSIPRCIHCEPAIATVGLTEDQAKAQGLEYRVVSETIRLVSDIERTVVDPEDTFLKVIIDPHSRCLLGCLAVGDHAPVIVNIATIAMKSGLTIDQLLEMPLIQPSASQALLAILRKVG